MSKDYVTPVARSVPFDNTSNGFTSTTTQAGIEEAKQAAANASRGPTICGFDGNAIATRYLEFFSNNPSNTNPFIIAEPSQLIALSVVSSVNSTGTVTVYKNGVSATTISLSASRKNAVKNLSISFTDLDEISVAVTWGSISRPTVFLFLRTLP